ncbi:MAG: hypothetical protein HFJ17_03805 [Clostridia bacterium]|nr:hypothetical protein [Clostridia bacterium]
MEKQEVYQIGIQMDSIGTKEDGKNQRNQQQQQQIKKSL